MWLRLLALTLLVAPAWAEPTLVGRSVTFGVLSYDDPDLPLFDGIRHDAVVGPGIEFGLMPEGRQNGLDVMPVVIDISDTRIWISFEPGPAGLLHNSAFNGYKLEFLTDCLLFRAAAIDTKTTTLDLTDDAVFWDLGTLYINLTGESVDQDTRVAVDVTLSDCAIS